MQGSPDCSGKPAKGRQSQRGFAAESGTFSSYETARFAPNKQHPFQLTQPASSPHCQPLITIGDEIMQYDRIGNIQVLQRYLPPSSGTNPVAVTRKYTYQTGTSRLKVLKNVGTFGQWQYKYDPAGNTTRDEYRTVLDIEYGRANLPFTMKVQTDKRENYLYDAQDMRIYKEMRPLVISEGQFTPVDNPEFYLRDMAGNEIGILDLKKAQWTWYGFGRERFARMIPAKNQQPQFLSRDNGSTSLTAGGSGALEQQIRNELRDHTLVKGRTFPEKLIEADIRQKPNDPAVRMIVTETKLKEMQNNKPSLKADIIQEANIEHEKQQLVIRENNGEEKRMSAEELIKQPGDASLSLSRSGNLPATPASGSFVMPAYQYNANKVLGSVSFFIFDHLGSSRVVYKPNVNCNGGGVSYTLESVLDNFAYGFGLREYRAGLAEKYQFTQKERDKETGWDYFGARFRDSQVIPFTTRDKKAQEFPAWSPYNYALCNPVNVIDPDGEWPKWIHNRIIKMAFRGVLTAQEIKTLQQASAFVDRPANQTPAKSPEHYMSKPGQKPEEAAQESEKFISQKKEDFKSKEGTEALKALGAGMHTIMDKTSPTHQGSKEWEGVSLKKPGTIFKAAKHFVGELNLFRKDEDKVKQAAENIKKYYEEATKEKQEATLQSKQRKTYEDEK